MAAPSPTDPSPLTADVRAWWDEDAQDESSYDELIERAEAEVEEAEPAPAAPSGKDFVHLHVHSEYSLLDGLSSVYDIVNEVKRQGMRASALTDHGNLYGALDFYSAARGAGIKPIVGLEAYVSPRGMTDREGARDRNYFHLILLAKDQEGYQNLLQLATRSHLEGFYYKPRLDREILAQHANGLIALSACYSGEPSRAILDNEPAKARAAASWYREVFGEDYFLEIQDHGNDDDRTVNAGILEIHRELGIPLVATNDTHYARADQADAQDILLCVQTNSTVDDTQRMRMQPAAFYLKSPEEMWKLFGEIPEALTNTVAIAERCNLKLTFDRLAFPSLDHLIPAGESPQDFLARVCRERLPSRCGDTLRDEHWQRLTYELEVIQTTGFASYILFVWDFVDWARQQRITCGPRGSAAGSLILFALGISDIDPVRYGLTFERFLNPERVQMPDVDVDFADDRREDVIQYVVGRYGRERVAQIITFGRLLPRAAIRDVGRALGYPLGEVDRVAKLVPSLPVGLKINQAIEQNPELKKLYESDPKVAKLIDTARSVEGVTRHAGTHAAGVVVADRPLVQYVPLQKSSRGDSVMTQYSAKNLEKIGLLKMDFLGLANMTMLQKALANIQATRGVELDLVHGIPYDDAATYQMLSRGETRTVFQLEGSGMTRYIQELKPGTVDHLAAMVALYRPGPMAHIPAYIARREGREAPLPPDPSLQDVLAESYGIIVYQDQVLQVVRKVAGYSLGQADVLRRAMGKKDKEIMAEEGPKFVQAALEHGYTRQTAEHLWELLTPFAGYAFNKAHAYCYAFLAYQTAYLKTNYPVEWLAAVLSTVRDDTEKVAGVLGECRRMKVTALPPEINRSGADFTVEPLPSFPGTYGVRYGLCAVKNVGEGAVDVILAERDRGGPYTSLEDFCRRLDLRTINKRVLESLAKCGALDAFGQREALVASLDSAMASAQRDQKAASAGQSSLFAMMGAAAPNDGEASAATPLFLPSMPVRSRERAAWEKEVLGFHFADHPYQEAEPWLRGRVTHDTSQLTPEVAGQKVTLAGVVTGVRNIFTKTKGQMAVLTLDDLAGSVQVVVFPRAFEKQAELCEQDRILVIEGKVDLRDERPQVLLESAEEWTPPPAGSVPPPMPERVAAPSAAVRAPAGGPVAGGGPGAANGYGNGSIGAGAHASNGHSGLNGYANGNGATAGSAPSVLRIVVPRPDDATCQRMLAQLHALVEQNPGPDRIELTLLDREGRRVRLEGASIGVKRSPALEEQLRQVMNSSTPTSPRGTGGA